MTPTVIAEQFAALASAVLTGFGVAALSMAAIVCLRAYLRLREL